MSYIYLRDERACVLTVGDDELDVGETSEMMSLCEVCDTQVKLQIFYF